MNVINKPTVLLVDDDGMIRNVLRVILNSEGYRVVDEASSGEAAITLCARHKPDLVLLDINLPKMSGLQVLAEIHQTSPATRVLMVSADSSQDKIEEAVKNGAAGFVVKPITAANVLTRVANCLKRKTSP